MSTLPYANAILSQACSQVSLDSQELIEEEQDCDVGVMAIGVHLDINDNHEVTQQYPSGSPAVNYIFGNRN